MKYDVPMQLGKVTEGNLRQLKLLNSVLFPVSYSKEFYRSIIAEKQFCRLAYYGDLMVGNICVRFIPSDTGRVVYITTFGVLAPYRKQGLGTKLLNHVIDTSKTENTNTSQKKIEKITLHVQVSNADAIEFYKKFNFVEGAVVKDYYNNLDCNDAIELELVL
eukprot:GCRY01002391.1.p1 GENE.GCRY01002391.1~~GCRY01002391.1.p1  ORF type:complete len:162 (+),score=19.86 GCRY01002391.1:105-590(+)